MKLITLNVEGNRHRAQVAAFLAEQAADVVCLQEANRHHEAALAGLGYGVTFLPFFLKDYGDEVLPEGCLIATRTPAEGKGAYYHRAGPGIVLYDIARMRETTAYGYVFVTTEIGGTVYRIATTHFTWTPDGAQPNDFQRRDLDVMLGMLAAEGPHVLCADMNIPRGYSPLYDRLAGTYRDEIPADVRSTLDRSRHRLGARPDKQILFERYVVDYVLSQPPYRVRTVRLAFGLSDHAAVIAELA